MSDTRQSGPIDSSIPPYVPPEADGDMRSVLRTPWARRWALVVLLLMVAWTAVAWGLNTRHHEQRVAGVVAAASSGSAWSLARSPGTGSSTSAAPGPAATAPWRIVGSRVSMWATPSSWASPWRRPSSTSPSLASACEVADWTMPSRRW